MKKTVYDWHFKTKCLGTVQDVKAIRTLPDSGDFVERNFFESISDFFFYGLFGLSVGIIGPDNCGKTVLFDLLLFQFLNLKQDTTRVPEFATLVTISSGSREIHLKAFSNAGGQVRLYEGKKKVIESSDILLYVIRADYIYDPKPYHSHTQKEKLAHANAVRADFDIINSLARHKKKAVIVVGNFFGKLRMGPQPCEGNECCIPNFLDSSNKDRYLRKFVELLDSSTSYKYSSLKAENVLFVAGSLCSLEKANALAVDILSCLRG